MSCQDFRMDKILKALNKFNRKEQDKIKSVLVKINKNQVSVLDVKKLKGRDDIYRVRSGKIRIIYRQKDGVIKLLAIERRSDITYNV